MNDENQNNANEPKIVEEIKRKMLDKIPLLRTLRTVQILLIRQTHDYTILRTEDSRELNLAVTPTSIDKPKQYTRVVFLASKQKAPETREFAATVKMLYSNHKTQKTDNKGKGENILSLTSEQEEAILGCELKDRLCRACPRCTLFGAVVTDQKKNKIWKNRWNIKHRIEYSSAFSIESYDSIGENITFNAVTESTQLTEQALGTTENVLPLVNFPSIVSLNSPTWEELVLVIKNLLRCKSYGAEGRTKGDVINYITGLIVADEEVLTSMEYVLELSGTGSTGIDVLQRTYDVATKYCNLAAFPKATRILTRQELETFVDYVSKMELDDGFVKKLFENSIEYGKDVDKLGE